MADYENDYRILFKLVSQMRTAQTEYFIRIGKAKKSRNPDDFQAAKRALMLSKELEAECDRTIAAGIKLLQP